MQEKDEILYIERVRAANNDPVVYVEDYIPYIEGMYEEYSKSKNESLLTFLEIFGYNVAFSNCNIKSVISNKDIQKNYHLSPLKL